MTSKTCSKCRQTLTEGDFYKAKPGRTKSWCKSCEKSYQKAMYANDPEKRRLRATNYRERYAAKISAYKKSNRTKFYIYELKNKYGLTKDKAEEMLRVSGNSCGCCGVVFVSSIPSQRRNLDHCHKTGKIGTFICTRCNTVLGLIRDDKSILAKFSRYITKHRSCTTS